MRFGSKMNNSVKVILSEQAMNSLFVNNIGFFEGVITFCFNIGQIFKITCIGKLIGINNQVIRIIIYKSSDNMRSDKSCTSGYKNYFFLLSSYFVFSYISFPIPRLFSSLHQEYLLFSSQAPDLPSEGSAHIFSISPGLRPVILYLSLIPETLSNDLIASRTETPFPVPRLKIS